MPFIFKIFAMFLILFIVSYEFFIIIFKANYVNLIFSRYFILFSGVVVSKQFL